MKIIIKVLFHFILFCGISFSQNIQDSLIANYTFDGHANDISLNKNNGKVYGPLVAIDRFNNQNGSYYFDGIDDYILIEDNDILTPTNNKLTISLWTKIFYPGNKNILYKGSTLYNREYAVGLRIDSLYSFQINDNGSGTVRSSVVNQNKIKQSTWNHIACVWDGEVQSIYIDGILTNETLANINIGNYESDLFIGSYGGSLSEYALNGYIDEVLIFNRALLPEEIEHLYKVANNFVADTTFGMVPLKVRFSDESIALDSINKYNKWQWDFDNDGIIDSEEQNPEWIFTEKGFYSVKLTISNSLTSRVLLKENYISVFGISPFISSIEDVPNDQGGMVKVKFGRSIHDTDTLILSKVYSTELYTVEGKIDDNWIAVGSTVAYGKAMYNILVPTVRDSTWESDGLIKFRIVAGMEEGNFISEEKYGYSVDNIKPSTPLGLNAQIDEDNSVKLVWDENNDDDLGYYNIYRNNENFFDNNSQPITSVTKSSYIDIHVDSAKTYYYSIKSVDYSGNESDFSAISSILLTALNVGQNEIPVSYSLLQNFPNPFNPSTSIIYTLPKNDNVSIKIYDVLGNAIVILVNEYKNVGKYKIEYDGSSLTSGVYYYRMQAGNYSQSRKFLLLK